MNKTRIYKHKNAFIFSQQAEQVYFTPWPNPNSDRKNWLSVIKVKARMVVQSPDAPQYDMNLLTNELPCLEEFDVPLRDFSRFREALIHNINITCVAASIEGEK